ncbi:MAG TPA: methyltransferase domain-containing protein [Methylomirabilota bacterium]|nr:methyltransferase domain-containing protein [Methylomirabilota bacterium]
MAQPATWDPAQYLRWSDHRLRPAVDLLQRVPLAAPARIVDLGCGTGNVTALLRGRWPEARVTGVDADAAMLTRARGSDPGVQWEQADVAAWAPAAPVDLLYSNAALHWLDGHAELFPRLLSHVAPGGALAVQMPRNFGEPSHTSIYEVAREPRWRERLEKLIRPEPTKPPEYYWNLLGPRVSALDVWETVYTQALAGDNPVADFVKGSWLKPFLDALAPDERAAFEAAYRERVARAYPPTAHGTTLFPFRRLFIVARC